LPISGIIIAGGKSSRMGFEKAEIVYRKQTFLTGAIALLENFTTDIIISGHHKIDVNYPVIEDEIKNCGPIGGLWSCMQHIKHQKTLIIPIDMPLLNFEVIDYLLKNADANQNINVLKSGPHLHMLTGLYDLNILPLLENQISLKNYKLRDLLKLTPSKVIDCKQFASNLININRPEDLKKIKLDNGE